MLEPVVYIKTSMKIGPKLCVASLAFFALLAFQLPVGADPVQMRLKGFASAADYHPADVRRQLKGQPARDLSLDYRVLLRGRVRQHIRVLADISAIWVAGHSIASSSSGLAAGVLGLRTAGDSSRLVTLTNNLDTGAHHSAQVGFDRLALEYRHRGFRLRLGRQAVSWGGGLVFQPLDLFNPFAPTTIDQDYKPGSDLLLLQQALGKRNNAQLLVIGRRDARKHQSTDVRTYAAKFYSLLGGVELDVVVAEHFRDTLFGLGMNLPVGGAVLRIDLVSTRVSPEDRWVASGMLNIDYSLALAGRFTRGFVELYHNGLGVRGLSQQPLPAALQVRLARAELYNLMRNYMALGASHEWGPLWNQSLTLVRNLTDNSMLIQSVLNLDSSDSESWQFGFNSVTGERGDEFGRVPVMTPPGTPAATLGGGRNLFVRYTWFR